MARAQLLPFNELAAQVSSTRPANRRHRLPILARADGQRVAQASAGRQADRVFAYLKAHGPACDHELAAALGIELSSINSTRNHLMKRQLVEPVDLVRGPRGALRTRWGLLEKAQWQDQD
jgi:hypothetical protein